MALASPESLRHILAAMGELLSAHGASFRGRALVLPTSDFFPDAVDVSPEGVQTLLERTLQYSPLPSDVPVRVVFAEAADASAGGKSCSSGACGPEDAQLLPPVSETEDEYLIPVDVASVRSPTRLITALARGVGGVLLAYTDSAFEEVAAASEIAAVLSGFGVLLLSGSNIFMKGCSGVKVHRGTSLSVRELAAATAFAALLFDDSPSKIRKYLETTQNEAFVEALAFAQQNLELVQMLREAPELIATGNFSFARPRGLFETWLKPVATHASEAGETAGVRVAPKKRTEEQERRLAEARLLVEEALGGE
jgi:hypothetical protein